MIAVRIDLSDLPDWFTRALWTFAQTFVALEAAAGASWLNAASLKLAALGGIAAGLSVAKTAAIAWWKARKPPNAKGSESP